VANDNLSTDKKNQKHHQKSSKICSNKQSHFKAFVSRFDLSFCRSIGGTTYPINADMANNNLPTDKTQKHH
jgi:hypothetical protein